MTRREHRLTVAMAIATARGAAYDERMQLLNALAPIAEEIRHNAFDVRKGGYSSGATINLPIKISDCRQILRAVGGVS